MNVPWCTLLVAQARTNAPLCTLLMTQTRTNTPRCTLLIAQARTDTPRCTLLIAQARTDTPRCTLLMTQTRTNTPRCTLWVAQARVNTPQCYFKVCRAGRTPYLYSSREFTEHLRTFLKIQKNCVLRALLPFGGHLATFHKDAFRFLHRNSSYICLNCTFSFFTSTLSFSAQRNVIKGSGGLHLV